MHGRMRMASNTGKPAVDLNFADGEYVGDCTGIYELDAEGRLDAKLGLG